MTTTNTPTTTVATSTKNAGLRAFTTYLNSSATQNYLASVLQEKKSAFVNNIVALVNNSDNLQQCEPMSLMNAAIKATALNLPLDPNLGFAYMIPYRDNKTNTTKAQFQIGYRGLLQMAIKSGQMAAINVTDIREGELQDEDLLTGEIKIKKTENRTAKKIIGYVAYIRLTNGFAKTLYATREEIEAHALRFSKQQFKGKLTSVWASDFDAMAKKTVLKALLKFAPLSTEIQSIIAAEEQVPVTAYAPEVIEPEVIAMEEPEPPEEQPTPAGNAMRTPNF